MAFGSMHRWGVVALLVAVPVMAAAQEKVTEHTIKLAPGARPPAATIADMAWLAGHWTGEGLGGVAEELWAAPSGGAMLGMYRLVREGKPIFYELVTVAEHAGSLIIRLKHFNPDMTSWEEKLQTVDFQLVAKADNAMHFSGMSFRRDDPDNITVFLAIGDKKTGAVREEVFRYRRVARVAAQ